MAKNNPWETAKPRLSAAVKGLHEKDEITREAKDRSRDAGDVATIPIDDIKPRPHGDSRPLHPEHVIALAESCGIMGLLQPLAVDRQHHLVCGGHRLAALQRLRADLPQEFERHFPGGLVPVRVLAFDAAQEPAAARAAELEENERRKAYTREQVIAFAAKLRIDGYKFTVGRPRGGEIALAPTLSLATGMSLRTVRRYLAEDRQEGEGADSKVVPTVVTEQDLAAKTLLKALKRFRDEIGVGRHREEIQRVQADCEALQTSLAVAFPNAGDLSR
jgi:ParB family transcriptional regulator, chromosome partitioning protein